MYKKKRTSQCKKKNYNMLRVLFAFNRCGGVEIDRSSRMREIGVRSPVATDLSWKTGSDSSTAKRSATDVSVKVLVDDHYKRYARVAVGVARCLMAMIAEHRSKIAALHQQCWRLHVSEKFSSETKNSQQKKQTNKQRSLYQKSPLVTVSDTLKSPHCSVTLNADHTSVFEVH